MPDRPVVLFLCVHNSGRSVAGRVLLDHYAAGRIEVLSGGSEPSDRLNPSGVAVLAERGLDDVVVTTEADVDLHGEVFDEALARLAG